MAARLQDRVAVITGASSGIGQAIAAGMAAEGALVMGLDLHASPDGGTEAGTQSRSEPITVIACDVSSEASVNGAVAAVLAQCGRIDIVVNSAGIWSPGSVTDASVEGFDKTIAVNLRGPFLVSRAVIPAMRSQGGGSIIHIGSTSALVGDTGNAPYVAAKGGLVALTRAMALDHAAEGIRVNCLCPGMTRTPMLDVTEAALSQAQADELNARRVASIPMGRLGSTRDLVPGAIYLASDEASWVTGTCLTIDGGFVAGRAVRPQRQRKE